MSGRFSLVADLRGATKGLRGLTVDLSGAKSPELLESAKLLRRSIVKTLSVAGGATVVRGRGRRLRAIGGTPSAPGEAPRKQTGTLAKSVLQGPIDTGRRVGPMWFTGRLLEAGVDTALPKRTERRKPRRTTTRGTTNLRRRLVIARRPFMQAALDAVRDQMVGVVASLGETRAQRAVG